MLDTTRSAIDPRRVPAASAIAVLTVAVALAGCASAQPGAAALVGDRRISTQQVTDASQGLRAGNPELAQGGDLDRTVLFFLVISPYVLEAAQGNGAGVSPDEARALLPKAQDPDPGAVRVLQTFLALQKLQQSGSTEVLTTLQQQVAAAKPRLNPRYGTFQAGQMAVVDTVPNWIVPRPATSPSPTDAPTAR